MFARSDQLERPIARTNWRLYAPFPLLGGLSGRARAPVVTSKFKALEKHYQSGVNKRKQRRKLKRQIERTNIKRKHPEFAPERPCGWSLSTSDHRTPIAKFCGGKSSRFFKKRFIFW